MKHIRQMPPWALGLLTIGTLLLIISALISYRHFSGSSSDPTSKPAPETTVPQVVDDPSVTSTTAVRRSIVNFNEPKTDEVTDYLPAENQVTPAGPALDVGTIPLTPLMPSEADMAALPELVSRFEIALRGHPLGRTEETRRNALREWLPAETVESILQAEAAVSTTGVGKFLANPNNYVSIEIDLEAGYQDFPSQESDTLWVAEIWTVVHSCQGDGFEEGLCRSRPFMGRSYWRMTEHGWILAGYDAGGATQS